MNKKLSYYFKKGWSEASFAYKKLRFRDKLSLFVYFIVSFIGKLLFFTRPIFVIADQNIGKMIAETREFNLSQAYHGVGNSKKYLGLMGSYFLKDVTMLTIFVIAFIPFSSNCIPTLIFYVNEDVLMIFAIIAILGGILAIFGTNFRYVGVGYVGSFLPDGEMSDMMYLAKTQMKGKRMKVFWVTLLQFAVEVILTAGAFVAMLKLIEGGPYFVWPLLSFLVFVLLLLVKLLFVNKLNLASIAIRYEIYKDSIVLRKVIIVKEVFGDDESYVALFNDDEKNLEALSISQLNKKEGK